METLPERLIWNWRGNWVETRLSNVYRYSYLTRDSSRVDGTYEQASGQPKNKKRALSLLKAPSGNMVDDDTSNYQCSLDGGGKRVRDA